MPKEISWLLIYLALLFLFISLILILEKVLFKNCDGYFVEIKLESSNASLEAGKGKLIKGIIMNKGYEDEIKLYAKGPSWIVVKPEKIRLELNKTEEIFVYASPIYKGEFVSKILAESYCQKNEIPLSFKVD